MIVGFLATLTDYGAAAGLLVVIIAVAVVSSWLTRCAVEPGTNTVTTTDTVTVERQITKRDTVTETVPRTVTRYDTVRETDTAFVPVPTDWTAQGLIGTAPLDIEDDEATLTYFDQRSRQWTQNTYDIPEPTWSIAPSVTAEATPDGPVTSAALTLGRKSLSLSAGYEVAKGYHGWTVGLTWTPYEVTW